MTDYKEQVYQPEEDTYLLLECALKEARPCENIIEVGTGSGKIAGEIKKISENTFAIDINPYACTASKKKGIEVIRGDLLSCINKRFDLIIFNPPYLPTQPGERIDDWLEYALDGGISGRNTIERFAGMLEKAMTDNGRCLLLISSLTGKDEVLADLSSLELNVCVISERCIEDEKLYVLKITPGASRKKK
ncbi:release factor glutamine methyltransferase [Methanomicrobium sp. W14]|uniref:HemK2/MTQ2 family protein methyltransferase n=1 Tax=Methanomicrobium sp. W14 TaxID=2817839 RepID=UPI001AE6D318|nr:HemK2/MTQ2 family protein methyltransferase [Methanomicrobium sp. W14]MBP2132875.1 release factor glutamine methyltransferase [Methanomicrobium sp. W14]